MGLRHEVVKLRTTLESLTCERDLLRERVSTIQEELGCCHREHQSLVEKASSAQRQVAALNRQVKQ